MIARSRTMSKGALFTGLGLTAFAASAAVWTGLGPAASGGESPYLVQLPSTPPTPLSPSANSSATTTTVAAAASQPGEDPSPPQLPMTELAYFGAGWAIIELKAPSPAFVLGGGYQNARVERDPDGTFFGGVVEKVNGSGQVTDIILSFSGGQGAGDLEPSAAMILTANSPQLVHAQSMLDAVMNDPRYADAHIHLTGHSLGGAISTWLWGYSLSTYGSSVAHDRISATVFAAPPWGNAVQLHFGLTPADFGNYVQNYVTSNDIVHPLGIWELGVQHILDPYEPFDLGIAPANSILNLSIGHAPIAMVLGLGTPDWLTPAQRDAALTALAAGGVELPVEVPIENPLDVWDRDYGANGSVAQQITGTSVGDTIFGSDSADTFTGGGGADTLVGGTGGDRFVYRSGDSTSSATDLIADFDGAQGDRIDLRQIPISGLLPLGRFHFIGNTAPTNNNDVGYTWTANYTVVTAKLGGGRPDLVIRLKGRLYLGASNFYL